MSEEIKLSLTAAKMVIGMNGKKHYTIPTQVTLSKMSSDFEVEMEDGKGEYGNAGDYIGLDNEGHLIVVPADAIGSLYRPARAPKTKKEAKKVPTV